MRDLSLGVGANAELSVLDALDLSATNATLNVGGAFLSSRQSPGGGLIPSHSPYKRHAILKARGNSAA